ncbi:MAG: hypothetical protein ACPLRY_08720, partial [Candidatus Bathyarchaeales archaeon]
MFMLETRMKPVAYSEGVTVYCPENSKFSFFNSPYPAHTAYSAVDIYSVNAFGGAAPSPVNGKVVGIRKVNCPEQNFECSSIDYVILLQSNENLERQIKILHIEPTVEVGDVVKPGDQLGFLLRSGFFNFWTEPHIHIEVRNPSDPIRARGGLKFERLIAIKDFEVEPKELSGVIVESKREYSMLALNSTFNHGIPVRVGEEMGLLDGGIPHYKWFGVHMSSQPPLNSVIKLCGAKMGIVKALYANMCVAQCSDLTFKINGKPVNLGFYFHLSKPLVKIIPNSIGELKL